MRIVGATFVGSLIVPADAEFEGCTFDGCTLVLGEDPATSVSFAGCTFAGCAWVAATGDR